MSTPPASVGVAPDPPATTAPFPRVPLAVLAVVALLSAFFVADGGLPEERPADSPASEFAGARARATLTRLAAQPRPMGSASHAAAREQLRAELQALGLSAEVQSATQAVRGPHGAAYVGGVVHNVLARVRGTEGAPALLLMAHYDTLPGTPGAADDGAGVAAMLEVARALTGDRPPRRDVILLFSDGEEVGSLGAEAFVAKHPWAADVAAVINLEARGNSGPALLFEVIGNDAWAIEQFRAAVADPAATSLSEEVYRRLPNDTDLSVFKTRPVTGFNFAFVEGATAYHSATDTVERLDPRSLQHMGSQVLALSRRLADDDLAPARAQAPTPVFFSAPALRFISYPAGLIPLFWALAAMGCVALLVIGLRQRRLTWRGVAVSAVAVPILLLACALAAALFVALVFKLHPNYTWMPRANLYNAGVYQLGLLLLALSLVGLVLGWLSRRARPENVLAGGLLWWLVLASLMSFVAPGASHIFVLPPLMALAALAIGAWRPRAGPWAASLLAIPTLLVVGSTLHLLLVAFGVAFSAPAVALFVLALLLLPAHVPGWAWRGWRLPAGAVAGVVACLIVGALGSAFSSARPRPNSLVYAFDGDKREAVWLSFDSGPDAFTSQFVSGHQVEARPEGFLPFGPRRHWRGAAPPLELAVPTATLVAERRNGPNRVLQVRLASGRGAPRLSAFLRPDVKVVAGTLDGVPLPAAEPVARDDPRGAPARWGIEIEALPPGGLELSLEVAGTGPVALRVVDWSVGLPADALRGARPRPADSVLAPTRYGETTLVARTYEL